jgi:hypothetical protein
MSVGTRLAAFAVVLAASFGAAYGVGRALPGGGKSPAHEMPMPTVTDVTHTPMTSRP